MSSLRIRPPAVAGTFYPGHPVELKKMVRQFLDLSLDSQPEPRALVAPHAGYVYSGFTAACAYRTLPPASAESPRRVILVGPSHRVYLEGASVGDFDAFETPLGRIPLDAEAMAALARLPDVSRNPAPHQLEHSLEVHLPFLQVVVGAFTLVPLVYGEISPTRLAEIIDGVRRPEDLLIVSSDLSHFHDYESARRLDARCNEAMVAMDAGALSGCEACGNTGMGALLEIGRREGWRVDLADYRNSGDTAGEKGRVVGYASYLFHDRPATPQGDFAGRGEPA